MISRSKLRYLSVVLIFLSGGLVCLTILRGLSPYVGTVNVGLPSNSTLPIILPSIWPPRNLRISLYLDGELDLYVLDERGYSFFTTSGKIKPVAEFTKLHSDTISFEVPQRAQYYIILRNNGTKTVSGEIILTFWGFEKDLVYISAIIFCLGIILLIASCFLKQESEIEHLLMK
ncbi:MAG: hypothetical protein ACP5KW_10520, partial [Thermoproteota archaeon]